MKYKHNIRYCEEDCRVIIVLGPGSHGDLLLPRSQRRVQELVAQGVTVLRSCISRINADGGPIVDQLLKTHKSYWRKHLYMLCDIPGGLRVFPIPRPQVP